MSKKFKLLNYQDCNKLSLKKIQKMYSKYINPALSTSLKSFSFGNTLASKAKGSKIILKNSKKIIDLTGGLGVLNLGHNPKRVIKSRIKFQKEMRMEVHKIFFSIFSCFSI